MSNGSYRFDRSFVLGTVGRYLAALVVLALLEVAGRLGLSVYRFDTDGEEQTQTSAQQLAGDVREIMINRGGPVAARTVYPILERVYQDAGFGIAVEPSDETVASIEKRFGFTPQGVPPDWSEGWYQQGRAELVADEFCLQCHVQSDIGSVLGTVTVRRYFASEFAEFWRDTRVLGLVAMVNIILATGLMFFLLRRRMRPLAALDEAIGDLGKTGIALTRRVPVLSRDEFGKLAYDTNLFLDRMGSAAGDLKSFCDDLQQVSDRLSAARREIERQLAETSAADAAALSEQLAELRALEEAAQAAPARPQRP